jgi:hypothetical protein
MTNDETVTLISFLCGGVLLGITAGWIDQLVAYIRR